MPALVIFSDGSKRMAHNTDDLRERWELRKPKEYERIIDEHKHGIEIPQFIPNDSYFAAEVLHFRRHMYQFRDELRRRAGILKRNLGATHPQFLLVQEAQWETNSNIAICNAWLKEHANKPLKKSKGMKKVIVNDTAITITTKNTHEIAHGIRQWLHNSPEALREVVGEVNELIDRLETIGQGNTS